LDLLTQIIDFANSFVALTNERADGKLDFSVESLHVLDEILDEAHQWVGKLSNKEIECLAIEAGCYIFEVARKHFGGEYRWFDRFDQPILVTGQPEFEVALHAVEKVKMRINNGNVDSIPFFFNGYTLAVNRKKSALIV